jgi:hypothetical protein
MTPEIARLGARLAEINVHAERLPPIIDNMSMAAELRKIQTYLNRSSNGAGASRDLIQDAVSQFRRSNELPNARAARLVCWGIADTAVHDQPVLIEDGERFPRLLEKVDQFRTDLKPYRHCWRGLLNGYFNYDPSQRQGGRNNWNLLREYLWENRSITVAKGFQPSWVVTIADHLNLLTDDPCSIYGRALFDGDETILDPLRQDLGLNDSSWLTQALVEAQLSDTLEREDQDFREVLPKLLSFLGRHNNLQDSGLARVLNRYSNSRSIEVHIPLRDHTVARWGNPWLHSNDAKWALVNTDAKKMVAGWLKLEFIRTFFSLLSSDQMNDQRRLRFWERYVDDIDDMYFALGGTAETNRSPDFVKARKDMSGRWTRLSSSVANNNAFVMFIRNHVFVEFGEKGNALYVFDRTNLPFKLNGYSVSAGTERSGLKSRLEHVEKMNHADGSQTWEYKCEQLIYNLTGILPKSGARPVSTTRSMIPVKRSLAAPASKPAKNKVSDREIINFLNSRSIKFEDFRSRGGSLWVYAPQFDGDLPAILRNWNFVWVDRRNSWYWKQG